MHRGSSTWAVHAQRHADPSSHPATMLTPPSSSRCSPSAAIDRCCTRRSDADHHHSRAACRAAVERSIGHWCDKRQQVACWRQHAVASHNSHIVPEEQEQEEVLVCARWLRSAQRAARQKTAQLCTLAAASMPILPPVAAPQAGCPSMQLCTLTVCRASGLQTAHSLGWAL